MCSSDLIYKNGVASLLYFRNRVEEVKADVGKVTTWIQHMDPVPARGTFTMIAKVQFKNIQTEKQVVLTIR